MSDLDKTRHQIEDQCSAAAALARTMGDLFDLKARTIHSTGSDIALNDLGSVSLQVMEELSEWLENLDAHPAMVQALAPVFKRGREMFGDETS